MASVPHSEMKRLRRYNITFCELKFSEPRHFHRQEKEIFKHKYRIRKHLELNSILLFGDVDLKKQLLLDSLTIAFQSLFRYKPSSRDQSNASSITAMQFFIGTLKLPLNL